ncbi:MAG TPA: ribose-5-phosphate isomerase RpiA [Roseiflexaceae bacterium]|nr:ribose-5-phosphate isomerase RpiA [Roseiflexaceae bacterium]
MTEALKEQAAERALDLVADGMVLGLGTGSTARYVVLGLGRRLREGRLRDIVGVPTSEATAALAREQGVPLATLEQQPALDLAIDGADEIDPQLNLIKGLGGALLREKVVVASSRRFAVVADRSKLVTRLGERAPVPVEVVAFALAPVRRRLVDLGATPALRRAPDGSTYQTDQGNPILDCRFDRIDDPAALDQALHAIPGVVEHGLFLGVASAAFVAGDGGIEVLEAR